MNIYTYTYIYIYIYQVGDRAEQPLGLLHAGRRHGGPSARGARRAPGWLRSSDFRSGIPTTATPDSGLCPRTASYEIMSDQIMPCRVVSCCVVSCRTVSDHIGSDHVMSCHVMSDRFISICHAIMMTMMMTRIVCNKFFVDSC